MTQASQATDRRNALQWLRPYHDIPLERVAVRVWMRFIKSRVNLSAFFTISGSKRR
jgi:hypothetical protein